MLPCRPWGQMAFWLSRWSSPHCGQTCLDWRPTRTHWRQGRSPLRRRPVLNPSPPCQPMARRASATVNIPPAAATTCPTHAAKPCYTSNQTCQLCSLAHPPSHLSWRTPSREAWTRMWSIFWIHLKRGSKVYLGATGHFQAPLYTLTGREEVQKGQVQRPQVA